VADPKKLEVGKSVAGILIGGDDEWFVSAMATLEIDRGVRIDIPYLDVPNNAQYERVRGWFREMKPPPTLVFRSNDMRLSLFDLRWGGHSGTAVSAGKIYAGEAVYGSRTGARDDPLELVELQSQMDALYEWTGFRAAKYESVTDEDGFVQRIEASIETVQELTWTQGYATMQLSSNWSGGGGESLPGLHFDEWTVLRSTFSTPRAIEDHLQEQIKIRLLLAILHGTEISFRRHEIRDERFFPRTGDGRVISRSGQEVVSARTYREVRREPPTAEKIRKCVAYLSQIGSEGLQLWGEHFEQWQRVIFPAAAILSRPRPYMEDKVTSLAMCLEAAGHIVGHQAGEEVTYNARSKKPTPTTATWFYRCLVSTGLDWSRAAASNAGLARAIAKSYIDVKHYHEGGFSEGAETFLVAQVAEVTVRLLVTNLVAPNKDLSANWQSIVEDALGWFEVEHLKVADDGCFQQSPVAGANSSQ
jgi:hypothetical protein